MVAVDVGNTTLLDEYALRVVRMDHIPERLSRIRQMGDDFVFKLGHCVQYIVKAHKAGSLLFTADAVGKQGLVKHLILTCELFRTHFCGQIRPLLKEVLALTADERPRRVGELDARLPIQLDVVRLDQWEAAEALTHDTVVRAGFDEVPLDGRRRDVVLRVADD